jgi:hypothetical protein
MYHSRHISCAVMCIGSSSRSTMLSMHACIHICTHMHTCMCKSAETSLFFSMQALWIGGLYNNSINIHTHIHSRMHTSKCYYSSRAGIVDWGLVAQHYAQDVKQLGGQVFLQHEVRAQTSYMPACLRERILCDFFKFVSFWC